MAIGEKNTVLLEFSDRENEDLSRTNNLSFPEFSGEHLVKSLNLTKDWPSPIEQVVLVEYPAGKFSTVQNVPGRAELNWVIEGSIRSCWEENGRHHSVRTYKSEVIFFSDDLSKTRLYGTKANSIQDGKGHYRKLSRVLTLADKVAEINSAVNPELQKVLEGTSR